MRGLVPGLRSPRPLAGSLPSIFQFDASPAAPLASVAPPAYGFPLGTYTTWISSDDVETEFGTSAEGKGQEGRWDIHFASGPGPEEPLIVAMTLEGQAVTTGTFAVSERRVVLATLQCGPDRKGTYDWTFDGRCLRLSPIGDECGQRKFLLAAHPLLKQNFTQRMMSAFDDSLAPTLSALDNIDTYFDPLMAPLDFVEWLAGWFGLTPTERWSPDRRRRRISQAVELFKWWGTARAIRDYVAVYAGVPNENVTVQDNGGVQGSPDPQVGFPGTPEPRFTVRVKVADPSLVDEQELMSAIARIKPAHVHHEVEIVSE